MKRYDCILIDPSALLAVLLNEQNRGVVEKKTAGCLMAAPGCIHWEMGNALYGVYKRNRVSLREAQCVFMEFDSLPIRILDVDVNAALEIAIENHIPTYDAYYLQCALYFEFPLLTLDKRMMDIAQEIDVTVL